MKRISQPAFRLQFMAIILFLIVSSGVNAQVKTLSNGDKISFDGEYYDFRDSAGVQMIKMWIPPGINPIKGVLFPAMVAAVATAAILQGMKI